MRTNLLLFLFVGSTLLYTIATHADALNGVWRSVKNIADPYVQKLGKWAVMEEMKVSNCI
jgi:hypothetical protein